MEVVNAQIVKTELRFTNGFLTAVLTLDLGNILEEFGGIDLGAKRQCAMFVAGCLRAGGVGTWEELVGKYVRVRFQEVTLKNRESVCQPEGIGHIMQDDKWLSLLDIANEENSKTEVITC